MIPSSKGRFEVTLDGDLIFSKAALGRHAEPGEIANIVRERLGPEIPSTVGISEGTIVFIGTASAAFFVLGAVPMGWLADRAKRVPIVGWSAIAFGFFVTLSGFAVNAFMLFWTRFATGITKASTITVHNSLIADAYPINVRARMSAAMQGGAHVIGLLSPVLVAGIAGWAGGAEGWRWAWYAL